MSYEPRRYAVMLIDQLENLPQYHELADAIDRAKANAKNGPSYVIVKVLAVAEYKPPLPQEPDLRVIESWEMGK